MAAPRPAERPRHTLLILAAAAPSEQEWRQRLPGWTESRLPVESAEAIPELLAEHLAPLSDRHAFAADDGAGRLHVFSRPRESDELAVRVIHREVIEGVFGLDEQAVPSLVAITKVDKLKPMRRAKRLRELRAQLPSGGDQVIVTSAQTGAGMDELWREIHRLTGAA